jgi:predicted aspartyl protease
MVRTTYAMSWIPTPVLESLGLARTKQLRFRKATGEIVERWTAGAVVHAAGTRTIDEVVFGEPGDPSLLGAPTLEGLNVVVDPIIRRLVDGGAMPAAVA